MELKAAIEEARARREPITAKRFLPPAKPSRWSAEELAKMDAPIDEGNRFLALNAVGRRCRSGVSR